MFYAFALSGRRDIIRNTPRALPWAMCLLGFQPVLLAYGLPVLFVNGFQPACLSFYFTSITRYLLVDQNICGLLMRSTYCLLASCCRVYELDGCMVRMRADLE